jgi:hypothetical protein
MTDSTVFTNWRKSSRSDGGDNCVEVAFGLDGIVGVRHSKHPDEPVIVFTRSEWVAFIGGIRDGEFDGDR